MDILVDTSTQVLRIGEQEYRCAIGKNGTVPACDGREGDGKTPLGTYKLRHGMFRTDKTARPETELQFWQIRRSDGWCDDPKDGAYNRPVRLPYIGGAEKLWRDSHVYDIIVVLGHNDSPPIPGMGSAIFLHIARDGYAPTEGCVAVSMRDMLSILRLVDANSSIEIR